MENNKPLEIRYDVSINAHNFTCRLENVTRESAYSFCEKMVELYKQTHGDNADPFIFEAWEYVKQEKRFGFCGSSKGSVGINTASYPLIPEDAVINNEKFTCGSRVSNGMDDEKSPMVGAGKNLDKWQKRGNDDCCSYCGSASFEKLMEVCDKVIEGVHGYGVTTTDKKYKFYIEQPDVPNASFGAIKFYTWHAPEFKQNNEEDALKLKEANDKIAKATRITGENFQKRLSKLASDFQNGKH